jgi:uncharacterized membrane protein YphA (DoxX/SURF4 family)
MMSMKKQMIIEIIIFLHILLFLYAAGTKLVSYEKFVGQIGKSPILTEYAGLLAWAVPTIEILISIILIIPKLRLVGLYAAFALMVIFTLYIIAILSFSKELPCACGGVLSNLHWKGHLIFNIGYVLLGLVGILLFKGEADHSQNTSLA